MVISSLNHQSFEFFDLVFHWYQRHQWYRWQIYRRYCWYRWKICHCTALPKAEFFIEPPLDTQRKERQGERGMWVAMSCYLPHATPPFPSPPPPPRICHTACCHVIRISWRETPPPPHPRTPHCWIGTVFSVLGQKRGWPPFRGSRVLQLNLDSFCDDVRILSAVIGHLWAEIDFWFFPRKWWKYMCPQIFGQSADILTSRAGTVRERRRPYKLDGLSAKVTWGLHEREATSPERELFSQTWKKSEVEDSAEPK